MKRESEIFGYAIASATILIGVFLLFFLLPRVHGVHVGEQCYSKGKMLVMCQREHPTMSREPIALGWGYAYQLDPKNEKEVSKEFN